MNSFVKYKKGAIECSQACEESILNFEATRFIMGLECAMESKWYNFFDSYTSLEGSKVSFVHVGH